MPRYFRHYKNGQLYELLPIARIEADPDKKAVVYQAMYGAGRFVIGLAADIKILQGKNSWNTSGNTTRNTFRDYR